MQNTNFELWRENNIQPRAHLRRRSVRGRQGGVFFIKKEKGKRKIQGQLVFAVWAHRFLLWTPRSADF